MEAEGSGHIVVLVTASSDEEAHKIANELLSRRKAACVNIVPGVNSLFWWEGKIESANETLLVIKTGAALLDDVIVMVRRLHSYTVPEVIALPILGGNRDYLDWINKETQQV